MSLPPEPTRIELGRLVATPAALRVIEEDGLPIGSFLRRHRAGDWGDVEPDDRRANDEALRSGARLLSVYGSGPRRLWIITEAETDACPACHGYGGTCEPELGEWHDGYHFRTDLGMHRLTTTVMLPDDY